MKPKLIMWSRGSWTFSIWTALALLLGLLLLLSGPSLAQEPTSADLQPRTTVASNVREGPGLQHPVRRVLAAGTAVQVTAQNPDASWLQLQDGSWIFSALVQPVPPSLPVAGGTEGAPGLPPAPGSTWTWELPDSDNLRQQHLVQINALRAYHGLGALTLNTGQAAQRHALELAQGDYVSHWDRQGLSPYMRYSRDGGPGYSAENISVHTFAGRGPGHCLADSHDYAQELADALEGLMASPGHRDTLLGAHHGQVQLGLARSCDSLALVQVLITDLLTWTQPPRIVGNRLDLQSQVDSPARVTEDLQVVLAWEPLPQSYTQVQLTQTRCYSQPRYIAAAVQRNRPGAQVRVTATHCVTPRAIDAQAAPAPRPARPDPESYTIPLLARDLWDAYGPRFHLRLEVEELLSTYGDGIYTVSLWGRVGTQAALLGQYAVVVGERPDLW